jgi:serine/threonine protein kinase/Tfp pilus assembly protein PilF
MGSVWMADQTEPVRRRVAVKLIKPGMDSRQVLARFEAERQALALMDHPNIAKVFDGGATADGRPYFVMELVKGVPLTAYCDDMRLGIRDRLALFADVCRAVQHAHQKGVVHRDLKPSNVLVAPYDGRPVVKVIDFGIAKAAGQSLTDKTLFTGFGAVVGTPEYMSPEQAEVNNADIDTRSDVYSLGVLLYELLTGTTPLTRQRVKEAALLEVLRLVREEEPQKPSTRLRSTAESPSIAAVRGSEPARLSREVRGDLDWIVMRALEKDRNRRYETANGLAAEIDRYLAGEPVLAVPPSATYRFRKFARRNRGGLLAGAVVISALTAGTVVSTVLAIRARSAEADANANRDESDANFQKARQAVDDYLIAVSSSRLRDTPGADALRKQLLETALKYHQEFVHLHGNDPRLEADVAASHLRLAQIKLMMGAGGDQWFPHVRDAFDLIERLVAEGRDTPEVRRRLRGLYLSGWDPPAEAKPTTYTRETELRYLHGLYDFTEKCSREAPDDPVWQNDLAGSNYYLSATYYFELEKSIPFSDRAIEIWERLARQYPEVSSYSMDLARAYGERGRIYMQAGETRAAEQAHAKANALRQQLARQFPEAVVHRAWLGESYLNVGIAIAVREPERAEANLRQAVALLDRVVQDSPGVEKYQFAWAKAQMELGNVLKARANPKEAQEAYRGAFAVMRGLVDITSVPGGYRQEFQDLTNNLLLVCRINRDDATAANVLSEALRVYERAADRAAALARTRPGESVLLRLAFDAHAEQVRAARAARSDADARAALGRLAGFLDERASDPAAAKLPPGEFVTLYLDLATLAAELGDPALSDRARRAAVTGLQRLERLAAQSPDGADHRRALAAGYAALGDHYLNTHQHREAVAACTRAIELAPDNPRPWRFRGRALNALKQPEKALEDLSKAIELGQADLGLPWFYLDRATVYGDLKQDDKALADLTLAVERWPGTWDTWGWRGNFFFYRQRWAEAIPDYTRAVELNRRYWEAWELRGTSYLRLGRWEEAVADFTKVLEIRNLPHAPALAGRATAYSRLRRWEAELRDREALAALQPVSAVHLNDLAWFLATCPEARLSDPKRGVALARKAVELAPKAGTVWNTLGVARYRTGDWKAANEALARGMELRDGGDAFDWFFLAMAHWHLGDKDEARKWFDKAVAWAEKNAKDDEELHRFRREAEQLLGIRPRPAPEQAPPPPAPAPGTDDRHP